VDPEILERLVAALEARGVRYAIVGAVAMNLHGLVRATEIIDFFIAPEAANVDSLKAALKDVFDDPDVEEISTAELIGEYPSVRYTPPEQTFYLDILTRLGEAFTFADLETERKPIGSELATVVTPETLYRMKRVRAPRDTVRLKDKADAEMLRRRFGIQG
jgi:hypothetical protein